MESLKISAAALDGISEINRLVTLLHDSIPIGEYKYHLAELTLVARETSKYVKELATCYLSVDREMNKLVA